MIATTFIEVNGFHLNATEDEQFDLLMRTANGLLDIGDVDAWIEEHLVGHNASD